LARLPARSLVIAGKSWDWIAAGPFFLRGLDPDGSPASLAALLQMIGVAVAAQIPLGAGAERWKLGASCASTALLAGIVYPLFGHWVWGGGWLSQLGVNYGLGSGLVDAGGSGAIHVLGGLAALSIAWILGPRRGKYAQDGLPAAIPAHSTVIVLLGCMLGWLGWLGINSAGAILFMGAAEGSAVLIAINTTLSGAAGVLTAALLTRARFGRPDASLCANGWIGGLVAGSASCATAPPAGSLLIGAIAGALVTYAVEWFELRLAIDDPGGAISVHAVGGIWGLLAAGLFAGRGVSGQWLAQVVGIATLLGLMLPLLYCLNWLLDRIYPMRVAAEGERQGLDLYELGGGAYPEFITHIDEFTQS